jgi:FSR family fosmidomycin resistance protein-like MFS transporter
MTRSVAPARPVSSIRAAPSWARLAAVVSSHPMVDVYAGFIPPLIGVLQVRCDLTAWQAASLLSLGPLVSGLSQPLFAWLTDHTDSRLFGSAGLAVAAACLSSIGLAGDFATLLLLYGLGMLGVGAFHPVAAASVGQLAGRRRSAGVTAFFVAGMIGATVGPIISTRIAGRGPEAIDLLRWMMIPGLIVAMILHVAIRNAPHRHHEHRAIRFEPAETRQRWLTMLLLFGGNAMRYSVNIGLVYLYVRWAESLIAAGQPGLEGGQIARLGSIHAGELNALNMLGMGVGGFAAGVLVRRGREKRPIVLVPLLLAPAIALFPLAGRGTGYLLALAAGVGHASVHPLTTSLAQRLLPHRTSLASSLTMGGAWAVAMLAPPAAQWALTAIGLGWTFVLAAALLASSGVVALLLPKKLIRRVASDDLSTGLRQSA